MAWNKLRLNCTARDTLSSSTTCFWVLLTPWDFIHQTGDWVCFHSLHHICCGTLQCQLCPDQDVFRRLLIKGTALLMIYCHRGPVAVHQTFAPRSVLDISPPVNYQTDGINVTANAEHDKSWEYCLASCQTPSFILTPIEDTDWLELALRTLAGRECRTHDEMFCLHMLLAQTGKTRAADTPPPTSTLWPLAPRQLQGVWGDTCLLEEK